jgi:hypothetical protein
VFFEAGRTRATYIRKCEVHNILKAIEGLKLEFVDDPEFKTSFEQLEIGFRDDRAQFEQLLDQLRVRGFKNYGLLSTLREKSSELERLSALQLERLVKTVLLQRDKSEYLLSGENAVINQFLNRTFAMADQVKQSACVRVATQEVLIRNIDEYSETFKLS